MTKGTHIRVLSVDDHPLLREGLAAIINNQPDMVLVAQASSAQEAGARRYVLKSTPPKELVELIRQVHAGKKRIPSQVAAQLAEHISDEALTDREIEVLGQIAGGNRNRDIAEKLFITEETVKVH